MKRQIFIFSFQRRTHHTVRKDIEKAVLFSFITIRCSMTYWFPFELFGYSDYRKRWRDVISQHPGHSHGYKSVMAALLKANKRHILFAQMTQNAKNFKGFVVY